MTMNEFCYFFVVYFLTLNWTLYRTENELEQSPDWWCNTIFRLDTIPIQRVSPLAWQAIRTITYCSKALWKRHQNVTPRCGINQSEHRTFTRCCYSWQSVVDFLTTRCGHLTTCCQYPQHVAAIRIDFYGLQKLQAIRDITYCQTFSTRCEGFTTHCKFENADIWLADTTTRCRNLATRCEFGNVLRHPPTNYLSTTRCRNTPWPLWLVILACVKKRFIFSKIQSLHVPTTQTWIKSSLWFLRAYIKIAWSW